MLNISEDLILVTRLVVALTCYMSYTNHVCAHDDVMIQYKARTLDSGVVVNDL